MDKNTGFNLPVSLKPYNTHHGKCRARIVRDQTPDKIISSPAKCGVFYCRDHHTYEGGRGGKALQLSGDWPPSKGSKPSWGKASKRIQGLCCRFGVTSNGLEREVGVHGGMFLTTQTKL